MKIKVITVTAQIALVLFTMMCFYTYPAKGVLYNSIRIEPSEPSTQGVPPYTVTVGQVVMVNLTIENAENLYGYNISISWQNPAIVEFLDYYFHPFLDEPYTTHITQKGGIITLYAISQAPANPVNGSGPLVTLYYKAKNLGESLINFDTANCRLIRQDGTQFTPSNFKRGKLAVTNTKIVVEPEELSGPVGQTVKANVTVYNVVNLYGIQINLTWNPELLNLIRAEYTVPWKKKFELTNKIGTGYYALAVSGLTQPPDPYTGNYTFVSLEFNITKQGLTQISFQTSKLGDKDGKPIVHAKVNAIFSNVKTTIGFSESLIIDASLTEGQRFPLNLTITDAVEVKDFKIRVSYPSFLNFSSINFNEMYLLNYSFTFDPITRFVEVNGTFHIESTGNFSIATLEFQITGRGSGKITIVSEKSSLKNGEGLELLFKTGFCTVINWRNVGVTYFDLTSSVKLGEKFAIGEPITVLMRIENLGASYENVNVSVRYEGNVTVDGNSTLIYNETVYIERFGSQNSSQLVTFVWNTTSLAAGTYHLIVNATLEIDDDLSDNVVRKTISLIEYAIDLAIVNVMVSPPWVPINETASLVVIVKNLGLTTQTFNLSIYLDRELNCTFNNVTLTGSTGEMFFARLPRFLEPGQHLVNCTIPAVQGEEALQNNVYTKTFTVGLLSAAFPFETLTFSVVIIVALATIIFFIRKRR